jgi:hypothetical protein
VTKDKALLLFNALVDKTEESKVPWTPAFAKNQFEASFGRNTVRLTQGVEVDEDGSEHTMVFISLLDAGGEVIDNVFPSTLSKYIHNPRERLAYLYDLAKDQALGINEAVDEILSELGPVEDKEDEIPF